MMRKHRAQAPLDGWASSLCEVWCLRVHCWWRQVQTRDSTSRQHLAMRNFHSILSQRLPNVHSCVCVGKLYFPKSFSHDLNFHIFINLLRIPRLRSVESRESPFCVPGVACLYPLPLSFLSFNRALSTLLLLLQHLLWFCWPSVLWVFLS